MTARYPGANSGSQTSSHYDPRLQWHGAGIKRTLVAAIESFGVAALSDSTANDVASGGSSGDWPYELGAKIAAAYPAYTVDHILFSDANQDFSAAAPTVIQTGTAGARFLAFPGAGGNSVFVPAGAASQPTGDMDISVNLSLASWTPAAESVFAAHFGASGNRAWRFFTDSSGKPQWQHSVDGTTLVSHQCSAATGFGAGTQNWVRVTFQANDGSGNHVVKFYTSADGVSWAQLGATITTAGTVSLFNSTANWELGGRTNTTGVINGNIYECRIRSGIPAGTVPALATPGPTLLPRWPEQWITPPAGAGGYGTVPTITGAPVCRIVAGAVSGKGLQYLSDATRIKMLLPDYALRTVFLSTMHNDDDPTTLGGRDKYYLANYASWVTSVKANAYEATPVIMTENPRQSPAGNLVDHQIRREMLLALAGQLSFPAFDAFQTFLDIVGGYTSYVQADGIHPTLVTGVTARTGAQTWADDLYKALFTGV